MKDQSLDANLAGDGNFVFSVALPNEATRAAGNDSALGAIDNGILNEYDVRYTLEVYDENDQLAKRDQHTVNSDKTSFELRLIPGRHYRFVVWADFVKEGVDPYYNVANLREVSLSGTHNAMNESRDAYTAVFNTAEDGDKEVFSSASSIEMTLTRPFAKLRVVTNDMKEIYSTLQSAVVNYTTPIYSTFNALYEEAGDPVSNVSKTVDFTSDAYKYAYEQPATDGKQTLFSDYIFGTEDGTVQFTLDVTDNVAALPQVAFNTAIPVERNYLTTIYGPVLTDFNKVTVEIDNAFDGYNFENIEVISRPANNEIWYTNGSTTEATTPNNTNVFGANIVSNTYDDEKECWVIKFDSDVTTIGDCAFYKCNSLTSVTIPDSVTTIGESAFFGCVSLTSVTIPDSVTEIGYAAFAFCRSLTSVTIPDSVTTIGYYAFIECSSLTSVTIPDSVTTIGDGAFADCSSLQEFKGKFASDNGRCLIVDGTLNSFAPAGLSEYTIPDSVTEIGDNAFYNCYNLTSVTIGDSVTTIGNEAFQDCISFTSVTIPDSVTMIESFAFERCESLTSVTIGDSVTTIGDYAFYGCSNLKKVYCNATIPPSLGSSAFGSNANGRRIYVYEECVEHYKSAWSSYKDSIYTNGQNCPDTTIIEYTTTDGNTITSSKLPIISNSYDNGVGTMVISGIITVIPTSAFYNCNNLTSVTIPDSVTTIGYEAFYECINLTSVTIPDSVTTIGYKAFYFCYSLTSVTIPDSVTTIGEYAFAYCDDLTSVTIGDSVTTIGGYAFYSCSSLTSVTIPDSVTTIGSYAFSYCSSLTSVTIPDSVTTIGDHAFWYCSSLTSVTIPDSVTTIGIRAFQYCSSLTSVTIPDSVTTIGIFAFYHCDRLTSVTIPDSVTTIGSRAFSHCSSLKSVYCKATTPPAGGFSMFSDNASDRKIYVPMESVEAYKSASYWSNYKSSIEGYNF